MTPRRTDQVLRGAGRRVLLACTLVWTACGGQHAEDEAQRRGDEAWARGEHEEALAEYRLALRDSERPEVLLRVAHAYAELGRVDDAEPFYRRALDADEDLRSQAVSDLVMLARSADARGDRYGLAAALELALEFEPGIGVGPLALPLARYYADGGEFERALPFFQAAVSVLSAEEASRVYFDMGQAYEELGQCPRALSFFEQARRGAPRARRAEIGWHIGNCSFELAMQLRQSGRDPEALRYLQRMLDLGEPVNLLPQAHFEHAELLADRGECTAAVQAFRDAIAESGRGGGPLVPRAEQRIDEIRFGRPDGRSEGRC